MASRARTGLARVTDGPRGSLGRAVVLAGILLVGVVVTPTAAHAITPYTARPLVSPTDDYVNVTATMLLAFQPGVFAVWPGATVHLAVTQNANFLHTFTLSAVRNTTVPSVGWFSTHPPLVNLSLGTTPGKVFFQNFTAPANGTYEYVCEEHFPHMSGNMTSAETPIGPPSGAAPISPLVWELGGLAAVALVALGGIWAWRRRRRLDEERFLGRRP